MHLPSERLLCDAVSRGPSDFDVTLEGLFWKRSVAAAFDLFWWFVF